LSDAECATLEALSRKRTASQSLAERARVVLACAEEGGVAPLTRIAGRTGVSRETVRKWQVRYQDLGPVYYERRSDLRLETSARVVLPGRSGRTCAHAVTLSARPDPADRPIRHQSAEKLLKYRSRSG
jgi:hypothetical protein